MIIQKRNKMSAGIKVTVVGGVVNILLAIIKMVVGIMGNSRALVADAVHSVSDLVTDIVVILGIHYGDQPPDKNHHYGHKKIETMAEMILGMLLIIVAVKLAYDAVTAIWLKEFRQPAAITIIAALISILSKEWLYRWTKAVAKKEGNSVILANAWHHRSDAYSSVAVLMGLVFTQISPRLIVMDTIAGLLVSILILKVGVGITVKGYNKIIDTAPPPSYVNKILDLIRQTEGAKNPHGLKMRYIGDAIHMEVHIEVKPDISVKRGHEIAASIKYMIKNHDNRVIDVIIHVEPENISGNITT